MKGNINYIILVDDDHVNNFINKRLIEKTEICDIVKLYLNGESAISHLRDESLKGKESPEIIFIDINMPVMDGFEFLQAYNELSFKNRRKVFIVGLTTSTHPNDVEKLRNLGCNLIVHKPLTMGALKGIVDQYKIRL